VFNTNVSTTNSSLSRSIEQEIAAVRRLKTPALRAKYREVFGEESRSGNRQFLFRRVAWRMQAMVEGDLPERARKRALELADDAELRIQPPVAFSGTQLEANRDPRLPAPGTVLSRDFNGRKIEVKVLEDGFEWGGATYRSLSAIASRVAGSRWNGYSFFGLTGGRGEL
jgi:hypothetical protein